jgi:hypothetical protein
VKTSPLLPNLEKSTLKNIFILYLTPIIPIDKYKEKYLIVMIINTTFIIIVIYVIHFTLTPLKYLNSVRVLYSLLSFRRLDWVVIINVITNRIKRIEMLIKVV